MAMVYKKIQNMIKTKVVLKYRIQNRVNNTICVWQLHQKHHLCMSRETETHFFNRPDLQCKGCRYSYTFYISDEKRLR